MKLFFVLSLYILVLKCAAAVNDTVTMSILYRNDKKESKTYSIKIELFQEQFPMTVKNFKGFCQGIEIPYGGGVSTFSYLNTVFHRIIDGFVVQGGDVLSMDGRGSVSALPEYNWRSFPDEKNQIEISEEYPERKHKKGVIAMANSGPDSNGCQWYIVLSDTSCSHLDGKHTVFGEVVEGMDDVMKMSVDHDESAKKEERPKIVEIKVTEAAKGENKMDL
ncbi:uncharacterized protein NESG_00752 [Nematocida ausubeli]|uniref:Peptidyl-prolyl cis-trans isomerase n=1 Tax=Nematocida ausubeli (strain ATCC PRA-371 / ERTm2) TaxID=1913371 RepID=A0A086J383_NEMA1|nr:uncharacterized protein NESG_00752 [Nematocida ausubeli]KFG26601.1 hypothetical protein NESG_00752 [Nematocida ausubeli]